MNTDERSIINDVIRALRARAKREANQNNENPNYKGQSRPEDQGTWTLANNLQYLINVDRENRKADKEARLRPMTLGGVATMPNYTAPGNLDGSHPADDWQESRKVHDDDTRNSITREDKLVMEAIYSLQCEGYDDQAKAVRRLFDKHLVLCDAIYNLSPMMSTT